MAKLEIETRVIYRILLIAGLVALVFAIYDILLFLFIAYIVMAAVNPWVTRLEKKNWPRWAAALTLFAVYLVGFGIFFSLILIPLISETQRLLNTVPTIFSETLGGWDGLLETEGQSFTYYVQQALQNFSSGLSSVPGNIVKFSVDVFGGLINLVTVSIFTFYLILEREKVHKALVTFIPVNEKDRLQNVINQVDIKLGAWLRGQFILMLIIGIVTYVGLLLMQVPYALPLAMLAGLFEIVPIIGPILSSVPAILVAFAISPVLGVSVLLLYVLIQQLESSIIVPKVMQESVGIDPIVIIVVLMIGGRLLGPLGALLSVPITAVLLIVYQEWSLD